MPCTLAEAPLRRRAPRASLACRQACVARALLNRSRWSRSFLLLLLSCQAPWCLAAAALAASTGSRQVATGGQQKPPSPCMSALWRVAFCLGGLSVLPGWCWLGSGRVGGCPCPGSGKAAERTACMGLTAGCLWEFDSAQGLGLGNIGRCAWGSGVRRCMCWRPGRSGACGALYVCMATGKVLLVLC